MTQMNKKTYFNIGDRVECMHQEPMGSRVGTKGVVYDVDPDEGMVAVVPDGYASWHWFDDTSFKMEGS